MWIKICANTNLKDAALAAELGADALGFIFAASPRRVTAAQVAAITSHLPAGVEKIGVFDAPDGNAIVRTVREAGLTGIQIHSEFSSDLISGLREEFPDHRIIQTAHWTYQGQSATAFEERLQALKTAPIDAVLVDTRTATASGGTGTAFDWDAAREALQALAPMRLIVAGGLHAGNVATAIAVLAPWGVDVASGVEVRPGLKDSEKLSAFLSSARART